MAEMRLHEHSLMSYFTILRALKRTEYQDCVMYVIHIECFPMGFPLQGKGNKTIYITDRLFETEMLKHKFLLEWDQCLKC